MERACDECGDTYEAKTKRSRFCDVNCRKAYHRRPDAQPEQTTPKAKEPRSSTAPVLNGVHDRLTRKLTSLGVIDDWEAGIVLGLAKQLDSGAIVGSQYVSLSKEIDRRVDKLELAAERPDDPVARIERDLDEHRLRLVQSTGT